jgi:cation:H+ antiporter
MALWIGMLLAGVYAMQWGASRAVNVLDGYAARWGCTPRPAARHGAGHRHPEFSVNVASVAFEWPDSGAGRGAGLQCARAALAFFLAWAVVRFADGAAQAVAPGEVAPGDRRAAGARTHPPRIAPDAATSRPGPIC